MRKLSLHEALKRLAEDEDLTETGSSFHNLGKETKTELKKAFVREVVWRNLSSLTFDRLKN